MSIIRRVFDKIGAPVLTVVFTALFIAEGSKQLRRRTQRRGERIITNSIVALPAFALLRFLFLPTMVLLARKNQHWRLGVNNQYHAPPFIKGMVAFLIMDYTNYLWHVANHKSTFLWRFHVVHHTDHDLDITTAFRFHFGEMIGSVFFRGFFVLVSGATALQVLLYEILFEAATQFHHSNWKLPLRLERIKPCLAGPKVVNPPFMSELRAPRTASYINVSVNKAFDEPFLNPNYFSGILIF